MYVSNIKLYKTNLRAKYKQLRADLNPKFKKHMDIEIAKRISFLREYQKQEILLTYVSKSIEVDTFGIIAAARKANKIVAVPKCITEKKEMKFYIINSLKDLEPGAFGVWEPNATKCEELPPDAGGLCIVPGFSFDLHGYRLGYGQGYYDRFLTNFTGVTVGVCYHNCIKNELPHGYYDRPVDILVTNRYIRTIGNSYSRAKKERNARHGR